MVEPNVGPSQFCEAKASVDIVEHRSKTWWFGFIPTPETIERMAVCHSCGKSIREVYYTMRDSYQDATVIEGKCWEKDNDEEHGQRTNT